jgi:1-acyl-sn-glycerol-3-phosphate acyltransferase
VWGALLVIGLFPFVAPSRRLEIITAWSRTLLKRLGVHLTVKGNPPAGRPVLLVANHISWLDIWLIDSQCVCRFVAKAEVRAWPLIGWLAAKTGTLFIQRERRHQTAALNRDIVAALRAGACVALFPEGTTSDGRMLRRFFTPLLQPAVETGTPVVPVAIRYVDAAGGPDTTPAYVGNMTLMESVLAILAAGRIEAEICFLPAIASAGTNRREAAHAAQAAIAAALCLPAPGTTPETAPDR